MEPDTINNLSANFQEVQEQLLDISEANNNNTNSEDRTNLAGDNDTSNMQITATPTPNNELDNMADSSMYQCNICLDIAQNSVITACGHLFCWPCLHHWLMTRLSREMCPVCKAFVDKEKIVPIYGRNSAHQDDPRYKLVPRRPNVQHRQPIRLYGSQFIEELTFSFGFNFNQNLELHSDFIDFFLRLDIELRTILSKAFLFLAVGFIAMMLFI